MTTSSFCGGTTALSSINLDDTSLRQVRTAYYGGMNSTKRNVRRNLFGVINEEKKNQVDEWLDEKMAEINAEVAEKAKYWAFDFTQNTPIINSNESDYRWIACRCTDVPEFYLNRNSYDIVCDSNEDEECCKFRPIPVCVNNESADSSFVAVEENVPCTSVGVCPPDLLKNLPIVGVDDAVNSSTPEKGNEIAQSPTIPPVVQKKSQTQLTSTYVYFSF